MKTGKGASRASMKTGSCTLRAAKNRRLLPQPPHGKRRRRAQLGGVSVAVHPLLCDRAVSSAGGGRRLRLVSPPCAQQYVGKSQSCMVTGTTKTLSPNVQPAGSIGRAHPVSGFSDEDEPEEEELGACTINRPLITMHD